MPIEIVLDKDSHLNIVSLRGRLDSAGAPVLQSSIGDIIGSGAQQVLIDCSELRYVSSIGLGVFIEIWRALEPSGGNLAFAGLTQHVRSVFEMVGFLGMFQVYLSREEALANAQPGGPPA
jgi:anti-sigma B factor antagonist